MNEKKFYNFTNITEQSADLYIYGDITSWEWLESDVSANSFKDELESLGDVDILNVHINSYGGEVSEGLAIYNLLKQHKATVNTYVDGVACSIASVIAMAGDTVYMPRTSLMMIHNCWTCAAGNSKDLRKTADDLDKIMTASIASYMSKINITEEKLKELLDDETWLTADECIEMGFANETIEVLEEEAVNQHANMCVLSLVKKAKQAEQKKEDINVNLSGESREEFFERVKEFLDTRINEIKQEADLPKKNEDTLIVSFLNKFLN